MTDTGPALEAFGVAKWYGKRTLALDGIDLTVPRGSITALVGPNGAGKSTLIKAWVGFERPTRGRVAVAGIDPWRDRSAVLARVGYVPQAPSLYKGLTVAQHLDFAVSIRPKYDRGFAERRLEDLAIPLDSAAGHLSGGQRAQLNLALALGTRAEILLLDEPLASLDPLARREFLYLLGITAAESGTTVLLSSHVVADVAQVCARLVVLGEGRKLLDESIATALAGHVARSDHGTPLPPGITTIGEFIDPVGAVVTLGRLDAPRGGTVAGVGADGVAPATLDELVLGYLAAGRPGMVDRVRSGEAGR